MSNSLSAYNDLLSSEKEETLMFRRMCKIRDREFGKYMSTRDFSQAPHYAAENVGRILRYGHYEQLHDAESFLLTSSILQSFHKQCLQYNEQSEQWDLYKCLPNASDNWTRYKESNNKTLIHIGDVFNKGWAFWVAQGDDSDVGGNVTVYETADSWCGYARKADDDSVLTLFNSSWTDCEGGIAAYYYGMDDSSLGSWEASDVGSGYQGSHWLYTTENVVEDGEISNFSI